jgi:hypothetical protein
MKPSTGAAVRVHRNAVRHQTESLSAFKWNAWPPSPESAVKKTQKTPADELALARKRLKELTDD